MKVLLELAGLDCAALLQCHFMAIQSVSKDHMTRLQTSQTTVGIFDVIDVIFALYSF